MDIPTPFPWHVDSTERPSPLQGLSIVGIPKLGLYSGDVWLTIDEKDKTVAPQDIELGNEGTGVIAWGAVSSAAWLSVSPPAGVALGSDVFCSDAQCERDAKLTLTVNPSLLPNGGASATVTISTPQTDEKQKITVTVSSVTKTGLPGVTTN